MSSVPLSEFADKLNEVMMAVSKDFFKRQSGEFYKIKVTMPQLVVLSFLNGHEKSNMTDMARSMNVTTAAMTGIIDRLARDRYVDRAHDLKDRRIVKVKLTAKGTKLVSEAIRQRRHMIIDVFGKISEHDRDEYLRILGKIHDVLLVAKEA